MTEKLVDTPEFELKYDVPLELLSDRDKTYQLVAKVTRVLTTETSPAIHLKSLMKRKRVFRYYDFPDLVLHHSGRSLRTTTYKDLPKGNPRRYRATYKQGSITDGTRTERIACSPTRIPAKDLVSVLAIPEAKPIPPRIIIETYNEQWRWCFKMGERKFAVTLDLLYPTKSSLRAVITDCSIIDPLLAELEIEIDPDQPYYLSREPLGKVGKLFRRTFPAKQFPLTTQQKYSRLVNHELVAVPSN